MAIDRAPFNALVDDDGSGLTGSVWNKAAIQNVLLDPIDAQPLFQPVPFNAANFRGTGGMIWTVGAAAVIENRYAVIGHLLIWSFYISWFSGANVLSGTPANALEILMPGGKAGASNTIVLIGLTGGVAGVSPHGGLRAGPSGLGLIQIVKPDSSNFALTDIPGMIGTLAFEVF